MKVETLGNKNVVATPSEEQVLKLLFGTKSGGIKFILEKSGADIRALVFSALHQHVDMSDVAEPDFYGAGKANNSAANPGDVRFDSSTFQSKYNRDTPPVGVDTQALLDELSASLRAWKSNP